MVNIYLPMNNQQIFALSIPLVDIERLTLRPVKWLRFLLFTLCGVRGELATRPNGPPVDYDISLNDLAEAYHFMPQGEYRLVDLHAIDDRVTSSAQTLRSSTFRTGVIARDGPACVCTEMPSRYCEAAHLLSKSKGDEYIEFVLRDRQHLYDLNEESVDLGINSIENGLLLRPDLHTLLWAGSCAFLVTPNFALEPADIPRVETGPMPSRRITLQHFETYPSQTPQFDACMRGTGTPRPSTIVLDYMYGAAAYRRWGRGQEIKDLMQQCFTESYKSIPIPPAPPHISDDSDQNMESDDSKDLDYPLVEKKNRRRKHSDTSPEMLQAMDDILVLSMLIKGTTPESMAAEAQRRAEAEELHAQEASKVKVQQWMQNSESPNTDL